MAETSINADIRVLLQDCLTSSGDISCVLEMIIEILQPKYGAYYFIEWDWDLTNESFLTHFLMV